MGRLLFIILASIATAGCAHHVGSASGGGRCVDGVVATEAALRLLEEKGRTSEYVIDRSKLTDEDAYWNVWFTRREYAFPGKCLIRVRKSDCDAEWWPLK